MKLFKRLDTAPIFTGAAPADEGEMALDTGLRRYHKHRPVALRGSK